MISVGFSWVRRAETLNYRFYGLWRFTLPVCVAALYSNFCLFFFKLFVSIITFLGFYLEPTLPKAISVTSSPKVYPLWTYLLLRISRLKILTMYLSKDSFKWRFWCGVRKQSSTAQQCKVKMRCLLKDLSYLQVLFRLR